MQTGSPVAAGAGAGVGDRGWLVTGGAFEELTRTGKLGPVSFDLLRRLVHQVRRSYGFPPPEGHVEWSDDAAYEVVLAMLTREGKGQKFVTSCFALATDDASLERVYLATIKHYFIDEAKKTPRGKLRRRIARLMSEDLAYRKTKGSPPRWALADHADGAVWQGDLDDLIARAARVTGVGITRWNHAGPTPKQTVHALKTTLLCVLQHAQGAVREEDLAKVLEARFELWHRPASPRCTPTKAPSPKSSNGRRPPPHRTRPGSTQWPRTSGSASHPMSGCCSRTSTRTPITRRSCWRSGKATRPWSCPISKLCSVTPYPWTVTRRQS